MKKYFIWFILFLLSFSIVNSTETSNSCVKPDEYILKCQFEPTLKEKDFTCLSLDCKDKLYTYSENVFIAEFPNQNKSVRILNGVINLNELGENINVVQILCSEEIGPKLIETFEKKVYQTQLPQTQSFTGNFLTIEKQSAQDKTMQEYNCYNSEFELYLGWEIETRIKNKFCNFEYDENSCVKQSVDVIELIKSTSQFSMLIKYSILLAVAILIGIIGLFTHLLEIKKLNEFLKITKSKLIISIILFYPIIYLIGKIIDLLFYTTFVTSTIMPAITFLMAILIVYFFSNLVHFTHSSHKYFKKKHFRIETKKKLRKKKRI